jgi:hypothetical protein
MGWRHDRVPAVEVSGQDAQGIGAIIDAAGLTAHEVPLRALMPILESGADEERPDMQERWANLLANAATSSEETPVAFPDVLRQLEPAEARILDHVYDTMMMIAPDLRRQNLGLIFDGVTHELGLSPESTEFHIDNLIRLRLVREPTGSFGGPGDTVTISEFGRRFVRACRSPMRPDPPVRFTDGAELQRQASENRQRWLGARAPIDPPQTP